MNELLTQDLDMARENLPSDIFNRFAGSHPDHLITSAQFASVLPLPDGYNAISLEVYGDNPTEPAIVFEDGELTHGDFSIFENTNSCIGMDVEGVPRYTEIEGEVLLNTLGGLVLPTEIGGIEGVLQMMIKDVEPPDLPAE